MALDFEQALVYKLVNTSAISTLCGSRVHPLRLPDTATLPAVTYVEVSAPTENTHDETAATALTHARYQIEAKAATYSGSIALAKAIFDALHGFKGVITSGSDTLTIQSCLRVDRRKDNDAETGIYTVQQDFMIWY